MLYLPATSVAAILGMPLFDWTRGDAAVVNSMLWMYFALAVPLTILTFGVWWIGLRRQLLHAAISKKKQEPSEQ
jgi:hypothetical protein